MPIQASSQHFGELQIQWMHGASTAAVRHELVRFWTEHGAITDVYAAWRRTFDIACIIRDRREAIVGVSSVYIDRLSADAPTAWFYRTFVAPAFRLHGLSLRVALLTAENLRAAYGGETGAPAALVFVAENHKLDSVALRRGLSRYGFVRLGADQRGCGIWQYSFSVAARP